MRFNTENTTLKMIKWVTLISFILDIIITLIMNLRFLNLSTEKLCDTEKVSRRKKSLKREADSAPDHSLDSCFVVTVTASNLKRDTVVMLLPYYFYSKFDLSERCFSLFLITLANLACGGICSIFRKSLHCQMV